MSLWSKIPRLLFSRRKLFLTGFDISPAWKFPDGFNPRDYAGMCLCQRLRNRSGTDLLLVWWEDPDSYSNFWSIQLSKDLKVSPSPTFTGASIEQEPREQPWWSNPKKWTPWTVTFAAALVTILGNFSQLENYSAWLFAMPKAEILSSTLVTKLVKGEISTIEFKIHNRSRGVSKINELRAVSDSPNALSIADQLGPLTPLEPGELRTVTFPLLPNATGRQRISLTGEATSGRLRPRAVLLPVVLHVEVWPPLEESPRVSLRKSHKDAAIYVIEAHHGKPLTRTIVYQATGPEELNFVALKGGKVDFQSNAGEGAAVITWEKDTTPLIPQTFTLTVRGDKQYSKEQWKSYENNIKIDAAPAIEP
jgi:hypothetical protein